MLRRLLPPLQIHAWGGLGSQLFGAALAFDLQSRFSFRNIVLVLHSSGVTKRAPDIRELFPELKYKFVDDYVSREKHDSNTVNFSKFRLRFVFQSLALKFSIIARENDGVNHRVRFWTLQVRGHYFYRKIKNDFIALLGKRLELISQVDLEGIKNHVALHYRLGDLLELENKSPVRASRISSTLNLIPNDKEIFMYSDSASFAAELLSVEIPQRRIQLQTLNILETLASCIRADTFIGTSSKISYWVALLRCSYLKNFENYLPIEDMEIMHKLSANCNFSFYE